VNRSRIPAWRAAGVRGPGAGRGTGSPGGPALPDASASLPGRAACRPARRTASSGSPPEGDLVVVYDVAQLGEELVERLAREQPPSTVGLGAPAGRAASRRRRRRGPVTEPAVLRPRRAPRGRTRQAGSPPARRGRKSSSDGALESASATRPTSPSPVPRGSDRASRAPGSVEVDGSGRLSQQKRAPPPPSRHPHPLAPAAQAGFGRACRGRGTVPEAGAAPVARMVSQACDALVLHP
jgi:hypothetical protein